MKYPNQSECDACLAASEFDDFWACAWGVAGSTSDQSHIHGGVHELTGGKWKTDDDQSILGDLTDPVTSPNDPLWFSHHAQLDRLFYQWKVSTDHHQTITTLLIDRSCYLVGSNRTRFIYRRRSLWHILRRQCNESSASRAQPQRLLVSLLLLRRISTFDCSRGLLLLATSSFQVYLCVERTIHNRESSFPLHLFFTL
jgi:hypothetical protein